MMISTKSLIVWLGFGCALSMLLAGLYGEVWLAPVGIGAWLTGGWMFLKWVDR